MDYNLPGSSVHGVSQARILEQVAISSFRGSFQPRGQTSSSALAGGFFTTEPTGKPPELLEEGNNKDEATINEIESKMTIEG